MLQAQASILYCFCSDQSKCQKLYSTHRQLNHLEEDMIGTLLGNPLVENMAMHVFRYPAIIVHMCMIYHTQVVHVQWAEIISRPWLFIVEDGDLHILAIIYHKRIPSLGVQLAIGCITDSFINKLPIKSSLFPCHFNVSCCMQQQLLWQQTQAGQC